MRILLILLALCSLGVAAPTKRSTTPVKTTPTVQAGSVVRTAQQDAELKDWIIGIQKLAQDAQLKADQAEKDAAEGRAKLDSANAELQSATKNTQLVQQAIDAQTKALNQAIVDRD